MNQAQPTATQSYRDMLRRKLEEKVRKNKLFSLRALARKSGISHPMLSQVLNRNRNLSRESAARIAEHLGFTDAETEYFIALVEYEGSRSPAYRQQMEAKLRRLSPAESELTLTLEFFESISGWHHNALMELTRVDKSMRPETAARRLGITQFEAQAALGRLEKLGLIERAGLGYRKSTAVVTTRTNVPSHAIREHHRQMIALAQKAVDSQDLDQRYLTDMTVALRRSQLEEVQRRMEKFKIEISEFLNQPTSGAKHAAPEAVYQLNLQLFELTQNPTPKEKRR